MNKWFEGKYDGSAKRPRGSTNEFILLDIKMNTCNLLRGICHIPEGTQLSRLVVYDSSVINFNIDSLPLHKNHPRTYNYYAGLNFIIEGNYYKELFGKRGLFYIGEGKRSSNTTKFYFDSLICHENTKLYETGTNIKDVVIDVYRGALVGSVNGKTVIHKFDVDIVLKDDSIPTNYLDDALKRDWISESVYNDKIFHRKKYKFDVENPPHIQDIVDRYIVVE